MMSRYQKWMTTGAAVTIGLSSLAIINARRAAHAEAANPPQGRFIDCDGVRLHYLDRGAGPIVVLIHGNSSMIADFMSSGLVDLLAKDHRVIVIDRPGYGHSSRPRDRIWTAEAQARVIDQALSEIGVKAAVVLGHSWGASVAVALALQDASRVRGLVLASGVYFPSRQPGLVVKALLMSGPALPVIGPVLRHTVAPAIGRLMWRNILNRVFGPAPVPKRFKGFPKAMALRPSAIAASSGEAALMFALRQDYEAIKVPTVIVAADEDRLIDSASQSWRLLGHISGSTQVKVPDAGHMVHQTDPATVAAAVRSVVAKAFPKV